LRLGQRSEVCDWSVHITLPQVIGTHFLSTTAGTISAAVIRAGSVWPEYASTSAASIMTSESSSVRMAL